MNSSPHEAAHCHSVSELLFSRNAKGEQAFAVVDAALWPRFKDVIAETNLEYRVLARKVYDQGHFATLPYLVELKEEAPFTEQIIAVSGERRCLFMLAAGKPEKRRTLLEALREGLLSIPHAKRYDGLDIWFRFYDPMVFMWFMDVATEEQKSRIFGRYISSIVAVDCVDKKIHSYIRENIINEKMPKHIVLSNDQNSFLYERSNEFKRKTVLNKFLLDYNKRAVDIDNVFLRDVDGLLFDAQQNGIETIHGLYRIVEFVAIYGVSSFFLSSVQSVLHDAMLHEAGKIPAIERELRCSAGV